MRNSHFGNICFGKTNTMQKFYNREQEIELLKKIQGKANVSGQFTVLTGRRRIGKTQLLLKTFENDRFVYFFVAKKSEHLLCQDFQEEIEQKLQIPQIGVATSISSIVEFLIKHAQNEPLTLIIDEFQELLNINPSIFSDLQRIWDLNAAQSKINLIVSGSIISLMYKIFENQNEPLFGRATQKIHLKAFTTSTIKEILFDFHPTFSNDDLLALYSFTGGVAKYVSLFMENGAFTKDKMIDYLTAENSLLLNEGKSILIEEFGKEYGIYFSILSEIASGRTRRKEIENSLQKEVGGYLTKMEHDFGLIKRATPMLSLQSETKNLKYILEDNFLTYWFRFIYKYQHIVEINANAQLQRIVSRDYETFSGLMLEKYFRTRAIESKQFTNVGNFWNRTGTIEIDFIAINELDKVLIFAEVKRQAKRIEMEKLKEKAAQLIHKIRYLDGYEIEYNGYSLENL